jgi:hypothetical protein
MLDRGFTRAVPIVLPCSLRKSLAASRSNIATGLSSGNAILGSWSHHYYRMAGGAEIPHDSAARRPSHTAFS